MIDNYDKIKKIPYGESDYEAIQTENAYYIDKTMYLHDIENVGKYLFFIRPRRFGKSLFLSVMETYYDITKKDRFELFFKGTGIFKAPTKEKNSYLILKFNFSIVNPTLQYLENSFLLYIKEMAELFISKYKGFLQGDEKETIKEIKARQTASDVLRFLLQLCRKNGQKVYVVIDEYDNFANTILSTSGSEAYENLTRGEGFFRAFFNVLKDGTSGSGAPISRLFITGVSPITMDDVTSGFNIGENISLDPGFNRMLGFTPADVREMVNYYHSAGRIKLEPGYLMEIIRRWYGNYLFSKYSDVDERLYNPDMIFYFLKECFKTQSLPDDLIDRNVRIDYGKLRHLIIIDREKTKKTNGNFSQLKEIIEKGGVSAKLEKGFPLEQLTDTNNFTSLLFYFGLLTIRGPEKDKLRLTIPNETVKRLYYSYIHGAYRETHIFDLDLSRYANLMTEMAYDGKWEALMDFITGRMRESMSLRDLITGEKSIQAFLNVYLGLSQLYIIHAEKEQGKGYADIVMEPFLARYEGIKYSYLLEIKYTNAGVKTGDAKVQRLKTAAEEQLKKYSLDKKFGKTIEKTTLIKLILVFSGHEKVYMGTVE